MSSPLDVTVGAVRIVARRLRTARNGCVRRRAARSECGSRRASSTRSGGSARKGAVRAENTRTRRAAGRVRRHLQTQELLVDERRVSFDAAYGQE